MAEATRGAVESIPREQHEAAAALGFGWVGRHAFVILPQALRRLLPPMVSLLVNIIQNTTIAQVIGAASSSRPASVRSSGSRFEGLARSRPSRSTRRDGRLLPHLVPAHAARRLPRAPARRGGGRASGPEGLGGRGSAGRGVCVVRHGVKHVRRARGVRHCASLQDSSQSHVSAGRVSVSDTVTNRPAARPRAVSGRPPFRRQGAACAR